MATSQKKVKQHRERTGLLYGILTVILVAVSIVAACTVFFRVESVVVQENVRYSEEQILSVAGVEIGSNLILTPKEQIAQRIYAALPYVEHVEVQKRFPTTLKLIITEANPVAVVTSNGEEWIIDSRGKFLEKSDETLSLQYIDVKGLEVLQPAQGKQVQVEDVDTARLTSLLSLLSVLEKCGMAAEVSSVDLTSATEILLSYDNRIQVKLLSNTDFNRKVQILKEILAVLTEWDQGTIDLKTEIGYFSPN